MDARLDIAKIDLSDGATFAQGFPHDHFTWAREHAPIYWHEPTPVSPDGEGFWVMTRHDDAMAVMLDPVTFSSDKGGGRIGGGTGLNDERQAGKFLNWSDDPRHQRLRSLVNKGFTNRAIHALEAELRRRADPGDHRARVRAAPAPIWYPPDREEARESRR